MKYKIGDKIEIADNSLLEEGYLKGLRGEVTEINNGGVMAYFLLGPSKALPVYAPFDWIRPVKRGIEIKYEA